MMSPTGDAEWCRRLILFAVSPSIFCPAIATERGGAASQPPMPPPDTLLSHSAVKFIFEGYAGLNAA
jgi:hypothetical protein